MTNSRSTRHPGHPHRPIRAEQELWDAFGEAVEAAGLKSRAAVVREFMAWFAGEKGAKLPRRPDRARAA